MVPPMQVEPPPGMVAAPWGPPRQGTGAILAMFTVVALLMLAGTVVLHARGLIEQPDWNSTPEQRLTWQRTIRLMSFVGVLLTDIGVFLSLLFGTFVAIRRQDLPDGVRRAMVMGPATLVGIWLIVVAFFSSSLFFLP